MGLQVVEDPWDFSVNLQAPVGGSSQGNSACKGMHRDTLTLQRTVPLQHVVQGSSPPKGGLKGSLSCMLLSHSFIVHFHFQLQEALLIIVAFSGTLSCTLET